MLKSEQGPPLMISLLILNDLIKMHKQKENNPLVDFQNTSMLALHQNLQEDHSMKRSLKSLRWINTKET